MGERPKFGIDTPARSRQSKTDQPTPMFADGTELPLFSGTSIPATERQFVPEDHSMKQGMLPGMPAIDYERVLERDRALRRQKHTRPALLPTDTIVGFTASPDEMSGAQPAEPALLPLVLRGRASIARSTAPLSSPSKCGDIVSTSCAFVGG